MYTQNIFEGGLFIPTFQIIIQADTSNNHLYCNQHALGKSDFDNTPSVLHAVIIFLSSDKVFSYFEEQKLKQKPVTAKEERFTLNNVTPPKDNNKRRTVVVEVYTITQICTTASCASMTFQSEFDAVYVNK